MRYVTSLEGNLAKIQEVVTRFNEEYKYNKLLGISGKIGNYSGKIAALYVSVVAAVVYLRYQVIDENDPWYELCALPSTTLAMLEILISCPSIILSNGYTHKVNENIFENLQDTNGKTIEDIKFLFDHTPTFSNATVNTTAIIFRCTANFILQPIDLLNSKLLKDIIDITGLRWISATGAIEEQGKVTNFMHGTLLQLLFNEIVPALNNDALLHNPHIDSYFYLLYKYIDKEENKLRLKQIYNDYKLGNMNFDDPDCNIHLYQKW